MQLRTFGPSLAASPHMRLVGRIQENKFSCPVQDSTRACFSFAQLPVAMRRGETPVHIPNTKVKTFPAEDTMLVTVWENRWLPDFY